LTPARFSTAPRLVAWTATCLLGLAAIPALAEPGHTPMNYFQAGVGTGLASTQTSIDHEGNTDWMLGYRFNAYLAVQAVGWHVNSVRHSTVVAGTAPVYDFSNFTGAQVVGFIPCTPYWDLYGELGGGQVHQVTSWPGIASQNKSDGVVGAGVRWQMVDHFALSLGVAQLWSTQVTNTSLRAEFNF